MNKWLKRTLCALVMVVLPVFALAEDVAFSGPLLLAELPEDAHIQVDLQFENGDISQAYTFDNGASLDILRCADYEKTAKEILMSDWSARESDIQPLALEPIGGYPTDAAYCATKNYQGEALQVTIVAVKVDNQTLILQICVPQDVGQEAIDAFLQPMIDSLDVLNLDETAEVG